MVLPTTRQTSSCTPGLGNWQGRTELVEKLQGDAVMVQALVSVPPHCF